jgi:hypothetical protein
MNCKTGDLAVIVGKQAPGARHFEGKIVRVTHMTSAHHWAYEPPYLVSTLQGACWGLLDSSLRPIRDTDGEDEVTRIARLKDEDEARRSQADVMAPRRRVEFAR